MEGLLEAFYASRDTYVSVYLGLLRYVVPVLAVFLLVRCAKPLLTFRREPEIWAWLNLPGDNQIPITHWENVIGRSKSCDVTINFPTVSRNHAVLV